MTDLPARRIVNDLGKGEYVVTDTGLKVVGDLAARGCSVMTIARALGMGRDAFRAVRGRQPEVKDALEQGRAVERDTLVGNIVANIFLLKACHQFRNGEARQT